MSPEIVQRLRVFRVDFDGALQVPDGSFGIAAKLSFFGPEHLPARLVGHDPSIRQVLAQVGARHTDAALLHTRGRPLRTPAIEMTDEIPSAIG